MLNIFAIDYSHFCCFCLNELLPLSARDRMQNSGWQIPRISQSNKSMLPLYPKDKPKEIEFLNLHKTEPKILTYILTLNDSIQNISKHFSTKNGLHIPGHGPVLQFCASSNSPGQGNPP